MDTALTGFLAQQTPLAQSTATSADGRIVLTVTTYLGENRPPLAFITSVRALVLHSTEPMVLVVRDVHGQHIVPGGRREPGEALEETLRREVLEETGWLVSDPRPLGFIHCHHHTPPPPEFAAYPYPDCLQLVYLAVAQRWLSEARQTDGPELGAEFRPLADVQALPLTPGERIYFEVGTRRLPERWRLTTETGEGS